MMQFAKESGIRVDDAQIERTIARIAQDNKMPLDQFKKAVDGGCRSRSIARRSARRS
jgi:parvulin-like peptidyl-prolyl isomerase